MAQFWSLFLATLVFVAYEGVFVDAICPGTKSEAEAAAKTCLTRIGVNIDAPGGGSMAKDDMMQLKQYCTDGTLDSALGCMEEIINDCRSESDLIAQSLEDSISISKIRSGLKYLCDNLQVIVDNGQCISDSTGAVASCIQVETQRYQVEMEALKNREGSDVDDVWAITCGYIDRIFACQNKIYKENCGKEIADVLTNYVEAMRPPKCAQYSSAVTVSLSWTLLISLLSLLVYLQE